jgi:hypothetical protein
MSNRFFPGVLIAAALTIPVFTNGCSSDASNPLCCNEFKVGATINADIGGSAQSQVAAQAVADFAGIASAAVDDVTTACRSMAQDLDAPKADQDAAEQKADKRERLNAWCTLAVKTIGTFKAKVGGTLSVVVVGPKCQASVSAKANCQAKCDVSGKCDIKANPPKCTGGSLEVACKGECTAKAGATLKCEGSCSAACKGSCEAKGGVQCTGKCDGTCKGAAQGGTGTGIKADGTCDGTCEGKCEVVAPGVTCTGSCTGECGGSCTGTAEASVKCDGECKADFEPLKCEGGKLEGGCTVDAKCDANCDASVSAKAECTPPEVTVAFTGNFDVQAAAKLRATFETNLSVIFAFQARLEGMAKLTAAFSGNISAVTDIKAACIPPLLAAVADATQNVTASASACGSIVGSAK